MALDSLSPTQRSVRMSLVRHRDTKPELVVRRAVSALGYRYRLQGRGLPGRPDLVFRKQKKVIFVHGCFWHRHPVQSCRLARLPKSRLDFWVPKLTANAKRDRRNLRLLAKAGWEVLVVWECQMKDKERLRNILAAFLRENK